MTVTEVSVKLITPGKLLAYVRFVLDGCFVLHDCRLVVSHNGTFLAMPERRITERCSVCKCSNHVRARFCNGCGRRLWELACNYCEGLGFHPRPGTGIKCEPCNGSGLVWVGKIYADIAHPLDAGTRRYLTDAALVAYNKELNLSKQPGYACAYDARSPERIVEERHG